MARFDVNEWLQNQQEMDVINAGGYIRDSDIASVIRGSGCNHIQEAMTGWSDSDIADLVRSGGAADVLHTIATGTDRGYEAATTGDYNLLQELLHKYG